MNDSLAFAVLVRKAVSTPSGSVRGVTSIDFLVNGESLLRSLVKRDGGHSDFMGCFVRGSTDHNTRTRERVLSGPPAETEGGRVLLYLCPECGDIGCGAYAVRIRRQPNTVEWCDFAYENGYEPGRPIFGLGPFVFDAMDYERVIAQASSAA